jgi:hypothetical protein
VDALCWSQHESAQRECGRSGGWSSRVLRVLLWMRRTARNALAARDDVLSCAQAEVELVALMVAAKQARLGDARTRRWALRRSTGCCSGGDARARRSRHVAGCSAARAGAAADDGAAAAALVLGELRLL